MDVDGKQGGIVSGFMSLRFLFRWCPYVCDLSSGRRRPSGNTNTQYTHQKYRNVYQSQKKLCTIMLYGIGFAKKQVGYVFGVTSIQ